jgi:hypothetical protein
MSQVSNGTPNDEQLEALTWAHDTQALVEKLAQLK